MLKTLESKPRASRAPARLGVGRIEAQQGQILLTPPRRKKSQRQPNHRKRKLAPIHSRKQALPDGTNFSAKRLNKQLQPKRLQTQTPKASLQEASSNKAPNVVAKAPEPIKT